jgi:ADP-heptose:LPS heptosyltransferase
MKAVRVRHFFKALSLIWHDRRPLSASTYATVPQTLLIVKLDAIGDYLLFRNFLEDIRTCAKFAGYRITLCGNGIWKELAEALDRPLVDDFIWVDKKRLIMDRPYRDELLRSVRMRGFEIAFQPTFSREILTGDSIIRASNAGIRTGSMGDDANELTALKKIADEWYTRLSDSNAGAVFEFDKNKLMVEELTGEKSVRTNPVIAAHDKHKEPYAVLFPGAGEKQKQWPAENFAAIADELTNRYGFSIKICGSSADSEWSEQISRHSKTARPVDLCGKTNLLQLIDEIAGASFLLTNDSSALHIGAAVQTPTVCVLNGRHYGRFAPYPRTDRHKHLSFVFPDAMDKLIRENESKATEQTKYVAVEPITSISISKVTTAVKDLLG